MQSKQDNMLGHSLLLKYKVRNNTCSGKAWSGQPRTVTMTSRDSVLFAVKATLLDWKQLTMGDVVERQTEVLWAIAHTNYTKGYWGSIRHQ